MTARDIALSSIQVNRSTKGKTEQLCLPFLVKYPSVWYSSQVLVGVIQNLS